MNSLKETVNYMTSDDYARRFIAEFWQAVIRYKKLSHILVNWERLPFTPDCPFKLLEDQADALIGYIDCLARRAMLEKIDLWDYWKEGDKNE